MKKGFSGIEVAIMGAIVLIAIVLSIAIPIFLLEIHIARVVEIQYDYNNAGMILLSLLSDREIYKGISLYVSGFGDNAAQGFTRASVEAAVKSRLDNMVSDNCYELSYSGGTIASGGSCKTDFSTSAYIVLPDGGNREKLTLSISSVTTKRTQITTPPTTLPTTPPPSI